MAAVRAFPPRVRPRTPWRGGNRRWTDLPRPIAVWFFEPRDLPLEYFSNHRGAEIGTGLAWVQTPYGWGLQSGDASSVFIIDDNSDSTLNFPTLGANFTPRELSLEAWCAVVNDNGSGGQPRIIQKGIGSAATEHDWMIGFAQSGANIKFRARLNTGTATTTLVSNANLTDGDIQHFVFTYNGATMRLYIDGLEDNNTGKTGTVRAQATSDVAILNTHSSADLANYMDGPVLKIAVYDRALSAQQVLRLSCDPMGPFRRDRIAIRGAPPAAVFPGEDEGLWGDSLVGPPPLIPNVMVF